MFASMTIIMAAFAIGIFLFLILIVMGLGYTSGVWFRSVPWFSFMAFSALSLGFTSIHYADLWNQEYWLHDVRTGDVMLLKNEVDRWGRVAPLSYVEFQALDVAGCDPNLKFGDTVELGLSEKAPLVVTVVGRATQAEFRYLVEATGGTLGAKCLGRFMVDKEYLMHVRSFWKQYTAHGHSGNVQQLKNEAISVKVLGGSS